MKDIDAVTESALRYAEKEVLAQLEGMPKTELAMGIVYLRNNKGIVKDKIHELTGSEENEIDDEKLIEMLHELCKMTNNRIKITVPKIAIFPEFDLSFTEDEIDKLKKYIDGEK